VIAVDTNVLVHAHRRDSPHHQAARDAVERLVGAGNPWAIPWPCLHEFLAIVTHPQIYDPPSPTADAVQMLVELAETGTVRWLAEGPQHLQLLAELLRTSGVTGAKVHDARVAALCLDHGVSEVWTADRDFSYFPRVRTRNPLV
jgi:toxin-antitoxin system PIN domain toxin